MDSYTYSANRKRQNHSSGGDWLGLMIFYVLPFIIVNSIIFYLATCRPSLTATVADPEDFRTAEVTIKVDSLLPVKSLVVSMDSEPIEVVRDGKTYTVKVNRNGVLEVLATNFNGMTSQVYEPISMLDYTPPTILEAENKNGILTLRVEDAQSGVDYSSIKATDSQDKLVEPLSVDQQTATIKLPLEPKETLNISISDLSGNQIQAHISCTIDGHAAISSDGSESDGEDVSDSGGI